jgi:hypothetical protein
MKYLIIALFTLSTINCHKQSNGKTENSIQLNKSIESLRQFAYKYEPSKIDFSANKQLDSFDINFILNSKDHSDHGTLKDDITNILLLKQYLFHLTKYKQGYDLLAMRKGQAKYIIDYFLNNNNLKNQEFVNSGQPYIILKKKNIRNELIKELLLKIERQESEISKAK